MQTAHSDVRPNAMLTIEQDTRNVLNELMLKYGDTHNDAVLLATVMGVAAAALGEHLHPERVDSIIKKMLK